MIVARAGSGWQTVLADLCLILFMITASALSQAEDAPAVPHVTASPKSEPLALYRVEEGAPPLREWLEFQAPDPRQQLTIVAQYRPGRQQQAMAMAMATSLAAQAGEGGVSARILVEPGAGGTVATLAYDAPDPVLARGLLASGEMKPVSRNAQ